MGEHPVGFQHIAVLAAVGDLLRVGTVWALAGVADFDPGGPEQRRLGPSGRLAPIAVLREGERARGVGESGLAMQQPGEA